MNSAIYKPRFNLKQIYKQLILLEDHLNQSKIEDQHCQKCEMKHYLAIEAYSDEMIQLAYKNNNLNKYLLIQERCYSLKTLIRRPRDCRWRRNLRIAVKDFRKNIEPIVFNNMLN